MLDRNSHASLVNELTLYTSPCDPVEMKPSISPLVQSIVIKQRLNSHSISRKPRLRRKLRLSRSTFGVQSRSYNHFLLLYYHTYEFIDIKATRCSKLNVSLVLSRSNLLNLCFALLIECIVYTWDYHSSASIWTGLRVQPILSDEVQTFKALIMVHKVLQEGHPITVREGQQQSGWLETCARTIGHDGMRGEVDLSLCSLVTSPNPAQVYFT